MIFLASGRIVILTNEVAFEIKRFTAAPEDRLEAGGILLGCYRGPHVEIVGCTSPMPLDRRSRYGFVRCDPGHQGAAITAWNASGRTVNFVGEWHTHPETIPSPSRVDHNTWAAEMHRRQNDPLIFLIAGTAGVFCGMGLEGRLTKLDLVACSNEIPLPHTQGETAAQALR